MSGHDSDRNSLQSEILGKNRKKRNNFIIPSLIFDVIILAGLVVFAYWLRFTDSFVGFSRYYLCGDPSLSYPYYGGEGRGVNAVSNWLIVYVDDIYFYCLTALLPAAIVLFGELLYMCLTPPSPKVITSCCDACCFPLILRRLFRHVGAFWLGLTLLSVLTDSIKLLSGSKRPYFLNVPAVFNYTQNDNQFSPYCFVDIGKDDDIRDASLSFPSYHSTMATYAATFTACYVQSMFDIHGSYSFRPIISACFAGMAFLASYTQWMLYRNHWGDLIVGSIIGFLIAMYISYGNINAFEEHTTQNRWNDGQAMNDDEELQQRFEEAKPAIFRWMAIPRLTMRVKAHPPNLSPHDTARGNYETNDAFQDELLRTMNNMGQTPESSQRGRQSTLY